MTMFFTARKHIKLLIFLLLISICFTNCKRSQNNDSSRETNNVKKNDSIIDFYFNKPETTIYSYIIAGIPPEIIVVQDTIEGIVVRESFIELNQLNQKSLENIKQEERITEVDKYKTVDPKELKFAFTSPYRYFSVNFENDVFLAMDYYFTNGVKFEYYHPLFERSFFSHLMLPYKKESVNYFGMVLVQNMYTPTRLDTNFKAEGDRPFASYLYLGFNKISFAPNITLKVSSELDIGLLGPTSLGGMIQTTFHSSEPTGWTYQINNDIIINYNIDVEKGMLQSQYFSLNGIAGLKAGSLYDNAYGGLNIIAGNFLPYFNGFGLRCNHNNTDKRFQYGVILSGHLSLIAYDATLQGGLFSNNDYYIESDRIKRLTHSAKFGLFFKYKWFGLNANFIHLSHEFKGGRPHKWVHLSTTFCL